MNPREGSFFDLSKKELNGIVVLCVLILLCIFLPYIFNLYQPEETYDLSRLKRQAALLDEQAEDFPKNYTRKMGLPKVAVRLFAFDPNTVTETQWQQLGLMPRQARMIRNYVAKGGRFRKTEDLAKIWSLTPEDYRRLAPYVRIPADQAGAHASFTGHFSERREAAAAPVVVEINAADSAQLTEIRGIGPAFASRIIKYRNRLGGFTDKNQLTEVFGLVAEKFAAIEGQVKVDAGLRQMIDINNIDFENLRRNPYLSYKQANAIIQYRRQHGPYKTMDDLRGIVILNDEILRKIEPYLAFK